MNENHTMQQKFLTLWQRYVASVWSVSSPVWSVSGAGFGRGTHRIDLLILVPDVDVRMAQSLLHGDTPLRVNDQHLGEQVTRLGRCTGQDTGHVRSGHGA